MAPLLRGDHSSTLPILRRDSILIVCEKLIHYSLDCLEWR